jgi:hypothetical protein
MGNLSSALQCRSVTFVHIVDAQHISKEYAYLGDAMSAMARPEVVGDFDYTVKFGRLERLCQLDPMIQCLLFL